jgi:hypothetical protein
MAEDPSGASGEVLFEFRQLGSQMRVAAIDSATGTEVVVILPATATRMQMQGLALAKLRRKLGEGQGGEPPAAPQASGFRGKLV